MTVCARIGKGLLFTMACMVIAGIIMYGIADTIEFNSRLAFDHLLEAKSALNGDLDGDRVVDFDEQQRFLERFLRDNGLRRVGRRIYDGTGSRPSYQELRTLIKDYQPSST